MRKSLAFPAPIKSPLAALRRLALSVCPSGGCLARVRRRLKRPRVSTLAALGRGTLSYPLLAIEAEGEREAAKTAAKPGQETKAEAADGERSGRRAGHHTARRWPAAEA